MSTPGTDPTYLAGFNHKSTASRTRHGSILLSDYCKHFGHSPICRKLLNLQTPFAVPHPCVEVLTCGVLDFYPMVSTSWRGWTFPYIGGQVLLVCHNLSAHDLGTPPIVATSSIISTIRWVSLASTSRKSGYLPLFFLTCSALWNCLTSK